MADLPHWHPPMLDEQMFSALCDKLDAYCKGRATADETLAAIYELDRMSPIYGEKTAQLRGLLKKRNPPAGAALLLRGSQVRDRPYGCAYRQSGNLPA